jgi:hypothetical protein
MKKLLLQARADTLRAEYRRQRELATSRAAAHRERDRKLRERLQIRTDKLSEQTQRALLLETFARTTLLDYLSTMIPPHCQTCTCDPPEKEA